MSLAARVLGTFALVFAGCRGPLPNPKHSPEVMAEVASSDEFVNPEPAVDPQPETETESSRPLCIEDLALDVPLQPVALALDPTGETSWMDLERVLYSPLWMPPAYPSDGRYPTPPGRAQRESFVMAFFLSAALIATSPWTVGRFVK